MRFYAENGDGYSGLFSTNDILLAIFSAWNYQGDLWEVPIGTKKSDITNQRKWKALDAKLIFSSGDPMCSDLSKYGYKVVENTCEDEGFIDGDDIYFVNIKTNKEYYWDDYINKLKELK